MVLTQLELENFKQFKHKQINFKPGLNVVTGLNETGKTSVREALLLALFANPASNSEMLKKHLNWHATKMYIIKLKYSDINGKSCCLIKDFYEKKISLECDGEHFKIPKAISQKIIEDIGISNEALYRLTSSLDFRSIDNFGSVADRKQVGKLISGLMSGSESGQDVLDAIKIINESVKELDKGLRGQAKTPGPIKVEQEKIIKLKADYQEKKSLLEVQQKRVAEHSELHMTIEKDEKRCATITQLLELQKKKIDLIRRRNSLIKQDEVFEASTTQREDLEKELNQLKQQMQPDALISLTTSQLNQLSERDDERKNIEKLINETQDIPSTTPDKFITIVGWAICLTGIGLVYFQWVAGLIITLLGVVAIVLMHKNNKEQLLDQQEKIKKQQKLMAQKEAAEEFITAWETQLGMTFNLELKNKWQSLQTLKTKYDILQSQFNKSRPTDEPNWQDIRRSIRLIDDELKLPEMDLVEEDATIYFGQKNELENLQHALDEQKKRLLHLDALINHEHINLEELVVIEEKIELSQKRLNYLNRQNTIGKITLDYLEKARQATMNPAKQILEKRAGDLLEQFTRGKYTQLSVDDTDMSSKILIGSTDKWEEPDVLSQGAFDQLYLSLRLSLSEILAGGQQPPLLLDEPLSAFDEKRFIAAMESLKSLAKQRQVIIFSCRSDYDSYADHVVKLIDM